MRAEPAYVGIFTLRAAGYEVFLAISSIMPAGSVGAWFPHSEVVLTRFPGQMD